MAIGIAAETGDTGVQPSPSNPANTPSPAASTASNPAAPSPHPKLSPQIASAISSAVPVWSPPQDQTVVQTPLPPPDPDEVRMETLTVRAIPLPRTDPLDWLTPKAQDVELVKHYITPFDRFFFNRFTLPIVGMSKEARARMMYEQDRRLRDMEWINDEIQHTKLIEPEAAKVLLEIRNNLFVRPQEW
jgi:hypothetical protein